MFMTNNDLVPKSGEAGMFVERFQNAKSPFTTENGQIDPRIDRFGLA
jgi:hypothetical protein